MKFKPLPLISIKKEFLELYQNIFSIESIERHDNIKYNKDDIEYIDYIELYRKELNLLDCSVNTGRTPHTLSRKHINNLNITPKDVYNKLCNDFPIQEQYRKIFRYVEEAYENVIDSMKNDDIKKKYNKLNKYKIKVPPSQKQYEELERIRQEITDFGEELSNIKLPDGYCNYKVEMYDKYLYLFYYREELKSQIELIKNNINESLSFLKDIFDRFSNEESVYNEATNNPVKYSDREYQERINNIEKDKEALKVFICLYMI